MNTKLVPTANWLTRPTRPHTLLWMLLTGVFLYAGAWAYWSDFYGAHSLMAATPQQVFEQHQWWRAWTTLFAHADVAHLFANSFPFFLFAWPLMAHFSLGFFPLAGFAMGGALTLAVRTTTPSTLARVGASGVVHWMGAAWVTLYVILENRQNFKARFASALFLILMLFTPDTYRPEVSYLTHGVGFLSGVAGAWSYSRWHKTEFAAAERHEVVEEKPWDYGPWHLDPPDGGPEDISPQDGSSHLG